MLVIVKIFVVFIINYCLIIFNFWNYLNAFKCLFLLVLIYLNLIFVLLLAFLVVVVVDFWLFFSPLLVRYYSQFGWGYGGVRFVEFFRRCLCFLTFFFFFLALLLFWMFFFFVSFVFCFKLKFIFININDFLF